MASDYGQKLASTLLFSVVFLVMVKSSHSCPSCYSAPPEAVPPPVLGQSPPAPCFQPPSPSSSYPPYTFYPPANVNPPPAAGNNPIPPPAAENNPIPPPGSSGNDPIPPPAAENNPIPPPGSAGNDPIPPPPLNPIPPYYPWFYLNPPGVPCGHCSAATILTQSTVWFSSLTFSLLFWFLLH